MRSSIIRSVRSLALILAALITPILAMPATSSAGISISVSFAPPELPVYEQPVCPGDGYIWTPGFWAWDGGDYYWVPGTWVLAPEPGLFWTPAYWGWDGGNYIFYQGYWGPQVGFYGGINYGFGYGGHGYDGGRWDNGHFFYNRSVNNVNVTVVHNVYNTTVVTEHNTVSRVSFNGGKGGVDVRATSQEEAAAHDRHMAPVAAQEQHMQAARSNTQLRASENHGSPPIAATTKPGEFGNRDVVAAKSGATYNPPANQPARVETAPKSPAIHPNDLPPMERPGAPNTGNPKLDQKYQQQQQKLSTQQDQARQKLQQQQDRDHQKMTQQNANDARKQQVEQQHQQQTQQMMQKQTQQQQHMQQHQQPQHQSQPPAQQHAAPPEHAPEQQQQHH